MSDEKIRVLLVDADPRDSDLVSRNLSEVQRFEILEVLHNRNAALAQVEGLQPDVIVVDLMLPGIRSIDLIRQMSSEQPQVRTLALVPADPPHDRIMLAAEAGAQGYICRGTDISEISTAIEQVNRGEPWLPLQQTYEVLQDGAGELALSSQERRARLTEVLMGVIPLTGLVAAITAFLWRHYWGAIGVRVPDLGVDPSTRMIDVLTVFVSIIGITGPLLFVRPWVLTLSKWIKSQPRLSRTVKRLQNLHLGKLKIGKYLINRWVAMMLLALVVFSITLLIARSMPMIMGLLFGPAIIIILLANLLDLDDELPSFFHLPHLDSWRVMGFISIILVAFLLVLGAEVLIKGPDLRPDGIHGFLAPRVLGFKAVPIMLYDLEENHDPLEALYLGGNADLYVLYDPCKKTVRLVPVGISRVELIDTVNCRSP